MQFAKQVVSNLHRKKIGHKRMLVSYTRDSSLTEINTLRCQVAGLLKVGRKIKQLRTSISLGETFILPSILPMNFVYK